MASKANIEKQLECPICLEQYKEPKVLSCLHSYCKTCLQKYVKKTGGEQYKISCPECRQETEVPNGDVSKLQGNFWVNNFISLLSISSPEKNKKPLSCQNCDSGDTAVAHCTECGVFMCDFCVKAHRRMHAFKNHQIVSIEEFKSGSARNLIKTAYCEKHAGETLKLFCQTCDEPICRDCTIVDHQRHQYAFIADAVDKEREVVRELLKKTKTKAPGLVNGVKAVEEMEKRVEAREEAVTREIEALENQQVRALEEIFAKLKSRARSIGQDKLKQLQAQREGLMIALASVNNSVDFTERALQDGGDVEVLSMKKQLVSNLSKLSSSTWECEPCEVDTFRLTMHQDISQVAGNLATVDNVRVDPNRCTLSMVGGDPGLMYDTWVGQSREFVVLVQNNFGEKSSGERVRVSVGGAGENKSSNIEVVDNRDGTYAFTYVPRNIKQYQLTVKVSGQNIPGSPFQWNVVPVPRQVFAGLPHNPFFHTGDVGITPVLSIGVSIDPMYDEYGYDVDYAESLFDENPREQCQTTALSWKIKIISQDFIKASEMCDVHDTLSFGNRIIWAIDSTSGFKPSIGEQVQNGIDSWQTGDVFILFLNTNAGTLRIQNHRTSQTAVLSGVYQGIATPYWDPDDSDCFSLDV